VAPAANLLRQTSADTGPVPQLRRRRTHCCQPAARDAARARAAQTQGPRGSPPLPSP
jgi:hypothetical protein